MFKHSTLLSLHYMKKTSVLLDLKGAIGDELLDKDLRDGLSAATRTGKYLWVAGDEQTSVQRLEETEPDTWGNSKSFQLGEYIELISQVDEMDIEGMDFDGKYLWIVGSHSYKRSNISKKKNNPAKAIQKLTRVTLDPNRILLARIPCVPNESGAYELHQSVPDPEQPETMLQAAKLKHGKTKSQLTKVLQEDEHLKHFIKIPGKDNGLDIEGVAAYENKLFLGLRGPVLRGWAMLLEIQPSLNKHNLLKLDKITKGGRRYRKFFMNLKGMGVRELAPDGKDLLILAGPTMDLDGNMAIYRWKNVLATEEDDLIGQDDIEQVVSIPYTSKLQGIDKAEGMALLENRSLLVLYDSPGPGRTKGDHAVKADIFQLQDKNSEEEEE